VFYGRQGKTESSVDTTAQYLSSFVPISKHFSGLVIQMDCADTVPTNLWCSKVFEVAKQHSVMDER
jgi:hypothetical protein